jgi:hypothetical protein
MIQPAASRTSPRLTSGSDPANLESLDALITAGTAASRAEAVSWVLARIRERAAYTRLTERARELDELKTRF